MKQFFSYSQIISAILYPKTTLKNNDILHQKTENLCKLQIDFSSLATMF